jgi:crotonobetainyl-CoA:carnitine CoA-transferase CaiB-like acyl-CoA transferase
MMQAPVHNGALSGLKVVDLTMMLAGPYATMLLADQGATVIKVEPLEGDMTRALHRPDKKMPFGGYFQSINRNKLSIAIDLKSPEGVEVLKRLIADADVIVENYRVGVMDRLGLSYETLAAINPRLVYAAVRGFGDPRTGASPYSEWPAFDVIAQAMGGMAGITGAAGGEPVKVGPGVGDIVPALFATVGVLAAVHHAMRTGQGQFVDVAMYDSVLALCERIVYQHSYSGEVPEGEGNGHPLLCPFGFFLAQDGWVSIACPKDHFWVILTTIMGCIELGTDPRYALNEDRAERRGEVSKIVTDWTRKHSRDQLAKLLGGHIPFGPVNTVIDIFKDPHVQARGMLSPVHQPGLDTVHVANTPIHMTRTPGGVAQRGALLGEHTDQLLSDAGYTMQDIAALRNAGVIH